MMNNNMNNMQNLMMNNNMNNGMMNMNNMQNSMMNNGMMNINMNNMQNPMLNQMMFNNNQMANMNQMAAIIKQMNELNQVNMPQQNKNESASNQGINVVFRVSGKQANGMPPLNIQCKESDMVSVLIQRYRNKTGDNDTTKKFIYNAKNLEKNITVKQAGISNNANIFVVSTQGIKGAY